MVIGQEGSLGQLLQKIRSSQQMSQENVAAQAGIARSTLLHWERGTHQPRLPELMAVLGILGASSSLREQALTLISAPRAAHRLRKKREANAVQGAAWVYSPESGDLLRAMRLRRHLKQEQVAKQMGIRHNTLSRWESGELIPSPERLDHLLTLLGAHPQERIALTESRRLPFLLTDVKGISLDAMESSLEQIAQGEYDANLEALKDLEYFRLEARLAQIASQRSDARHLLLHTYSWHAHWLANNRRYREAESYANRVLEVARKEASLEHFRLRTGIVASHIAVYSGKHPKPERGIEMLQQLLPLVSQPEYEAWIYGDIALFLKMTGQIESALALSARACRVALRCEDTIELRMRRVDQAEILLRTGLPHDAMHAIELLPTENADHPGERVREAVLWADGLLKVGETSEAHEWLERASAIVEEYDLDPTAVTTLAQRF